MQGLMMDDGLTISAIAEYGQRVYADTPIVSVTADQGRHRYTYREAFQRAKQLANALGRLDISPGDRIATVAWNDYRHFEIYYAVSGSGFVCHTINPRLFSEQIAYIVNHAEDQYIFLDPMFVPLLEALADQLSTVKGYILLTDTAHMPATTLPDVHCYEELIANESFDFEWPRLDEDCASSLCYTSGTTGHPKGVLYSHRSTVLHSYALALPNVFNLQADDVLMPVVPMFHVNAWGSPYAAVMTGTPLVFPGPKMADGKVLAELINDEGVTVSAGVPTIWLALLAYLESSGEQVKSLQRVVVGGAACPLTIMEQFEERYQVYTHSAWGMTEMSPLGTYNPRLDRDSLGAEEYARLRVKAGLPVFGVELKIVDDSNRELPWDGRSFGALKVRGPWVCKSYFKGEGNSSFDPDGWFDTGDVATIDPQGYMAITDRSKDVIKSGGEWISSIDLENAAVGHPGVKEAAVIGVPHAKWSERPLLIVVPAEDAEVDSQALLDWLSDKVARWWLPDACLFVDELPHTATGKISKKDLRLQFADYRLEE